MAGPKFIEYTGEVIPDEPTATQSTPAPKKFGEEVDKFAEEENKKLTQEKKAKEAESFGLPEWMVVPVATAAGGAAALAGKKGIEYFRNRNAEPAARVEPTFDPNNPPPPAGPTVADRLKEEQIRAAKLKADTLQFKLDELQKVKAATTPAAQPGAVPAPVNLTPADVAARAAGMPVAPPAAPVAPAAPMAPAAPAAERLVPPMPENPISRAALPGQSRMQSNFESRDLPNGSSAKAPIPGAVVPTAPLAPVDVAAAEVNTPEPVAPKAARAKRGSLAEIANAPPEVAGSPGMREQYTKPKGGVGPGGFNWLYGQEGPNAQALWEQSYGKTNVPYSEVEPAYSAAKVGPPKTAAELGRAGGSFEKPKLIPSYIKGGSTPGFMGALAGLGLLGVAGGTKGQEAMSKAANAIKDIGIAPESLLRGKGDELGKLGSAYVSAGNTQYRAQLEEQLQSEASPTRRAQLIDELRKIGAPVPPPR